MVAGVTDRVAGLEELPADESIENASLGRCPVLLVFDGAGDREMEPNVCGFVEDVGTVEFHKSAKESDILYLVLSAVILRETRWGTYWISEKRVAYK